MNYWKLGCNWGHGMPDFYLLLKEKRIVICGDPPPDKIGRVFLFSGEPKSLSAIADLTFVAANISKVDLLNKLPIEAAQNGRAITDELQKAMPNTAISLDVWKIDKWLDA